MTTSHRFGNPEDYSRDNSINYQPFGDELFHNIGDSNYGSYNITERFDSMGNQIYSDLIASLQWLN